MRQDDLERRAQDGPYETRPGFQPKFAPRVEPDENGRRWGLTNLGNLFPLAHDE